VIGEFSLVFLEGFVIGSVVPILVDEEHKFGKLKRAKLATTKIVYL
jgi:RecG-like helicase